MVYRVLWLSVLFGVSCPFSLFADPHYAPPHAFTRVVCNLCLTSNGRHKGVDLMAPIGTNFYSIADGGTVEQYYPSLGSYGGWGVPGQMLLVRYHKDDGTGFYVQYGHIFDVPAEYRMAGAPVPKLGTFLGKIADYDPCMGGGRPCPHMHFGIWNDDSPPPTHGYGYGPDLESWVDALRFIAERDIAIQFEANGGNAHGHREGSLSWWDEWNGDTRETQYWPDGTPQRCLRQDIVSPFLGRYAIVFDALGGARRAFTVRGEFWTNGQGNGWSQGDGRRILGMPIGNEYDASDGRRQDFQKGYLLRAGSGTVSPHPYEPVAPGWAESGWDNGSSHAIAEAYERNGSQRAVGVPNGPARTQALDYAGKRINYLIQEFDGGSNGHGAIFYDPDNGKWNALATNEAYYVYGDFWSAWLAHRDEYLAVPTRDWYMSRDPEHGDESPEYRLQNFIRPGGEQHYMIQKNGQVEWHSDPPPLPECAPDAGSMIANGSFTGRRCWTPYNEGDRATLEFDGTLRASLQGGAYNSVYVLQLVPLTSGAKYQVSFRAWSSRTNTITLIAQNRNAPWQEYGLWQDVELDAEPRQFWYPFTATATDDRSRFLIALGAVRGDVWIDDVVVRRVQCERRPGELIGDANFETLDCWTWQLRSRDRIRLDTDSQGNRAACITSSEPDSFWKTQIRQENIPLQRGKRYLLSQTMETDGPMDIFTAVTNGDTVVLGAWDSLRVDGGPYSIESMAFASDADLAPDGAKLIYFLARSAGTCKIGNVLLRELHCELDPGSMIGNGTFGQRDCWIFQHRMRDRFTVERDSDGQMAGHIVSSARSESTWVTQIRQENLRLHTDKRYHLHAEVKAATPGGLILAQLTIPGRRPEDWNAVFYADSLNSLNRYLVIDTLLTTPADSDSALLSFAFGNAAGDYWVRNVQLEERENCFREPGNLIASPGFEKSGCWNVPAGGEVADGIARIPSRGSGDPWSVSFGQGAIVLANRWRYGLRFEAKCSTPGVSIQLYLGLDERSQTGNLLMNQSCTLGSDWDSCSVSAYTSINSANGHLAFGLGAREADYYFRNIRLEMIPDEARDKYKQPFARNSIWNTPIGTEAQYTPCSFGRSDAAALDTDYWIVTDTDDPVHDLLDIPDSLWGYPGYRRCNDLRLLTGVRTSLPESVVVRDVRREPWPETPNNSTACLQPDGRTIIQWNAICRESRGGDVWGVPHRDRNGVLFPNEDIYGLGIKGCHGGSGLSSIGGSIRCGELVSPEPIRHALKVDIDDDYLYGGPGSFRWPAWKSDKNWDAGGVDTLYSGTNPELCMGSLLAISPSDAAHRGELETEVAKTLFDALMGYGAYVVDNAAWNCYYFCAEKGVKEEAEAYYGHSVDTQQNTPYHRDIDRLFSWLQVVRNNDSLHVGGGGDPIAEQVEELVQPERPDSSWTGAAQPRLRIAKQEPASIELVIETAEDCDGELRVFDLRGRLVAELFKGKIDKGAMRVPWDLRRSGHRVASGIYFARLRTTRGSTSIRIPVVR